MSKLPDIAVIIPIFEEQDSIQRVLSDLEITVGTAGKIYLVADNQNDGTILVVKDFMSESSLSIQILDQSPNFGPANAITFGIKNSLEPYIVLMTADNSDDTRDIIRIVEVLKSGKCVVSASRYMRNGKHIGGPILKHILSRVAGVVSKFILRSGTSDPTNLFKGVTRDFISTIQIESKSGFTIGLELVAKAQVHQFNAVSEIPTAWHERTAGKSSFRIYKWLPNYLFWYYMLIHYRILSVLKFSGKKGN
jgi:glycosyltransferase involved in cell wall biosynthesis